MKVLIVAKTIEIANRIYNLEDKISDLETVASKSEMKTVIKKLNAILFEKSLDFSDKEIEKLTGFDKKDAENKVLRQLSRGDDESVRHIVDWLRDGGSEQINVFRGVNSLDNAIKLADKYFKDKSKKVEDIEGEITIIDKLSKGFTIVELHDKVALDREGKIMQHCVGSYYDKVKSKRVRILSLRDSNNQPHATMEVEKQGSKNVIVQLQGKQNSFIVDKYIPFILEWLGIEIS